MKSGSRFVSIALLALGLAPLAGCSRTAREQDAVSERPGTVGDAEQPDPSVPSATPARADSGMGYLGIFGRCAGVIRSSGVETVGLLPNECRDILAVGPGSELYVTTYEALLVLREGRVETIPGNDSVDALAVAPDGSLWTVGRHGVGHFENGAWTFEPESGLGPDVRTLEAVAVDPQDGVYVAALNAVFRRTASGWRRLDVRLQPEETRLGIEPVFLFKALHNGADGELYALEDARVFRIEGDTATQLPLPLERAVNDLAVDADGVLAVRHNRNDVIVVTDTGEVRRRLSAGAGDFQGRSIEALDVDERGRLWLATDAGLYVFLPDGGRRFWPTGSYDGLRGSVESLFIVGAGPDELPAEVAAATATVAGILEVESGESAGVRVQLCPDPSMSSRFDTPCAGAAIHLEATTDATGRFRLEGVPLTTFGLAVQVAGRWIVTGAGKYGADIRRDEVLDIGPLMIPDRELGEESSGGPRPGSGT
jgi:hypothetical protein